MNRTIVGLIAIALVTLPTAIGAQSPMRAFPPGTFQSRAAIDSSAVAYVGPGDIVGSALNWYGLRAYNVAYATGSNPAATVCDVATGLTCSDVNILASGAFDATGAAALPQCAVSCNVSKLYDQTGHGWHITQATNSRRPVLTFNCIGALPCLTLTAASTQFLSNTNSQSCPNGTTTVAQPFTISAIAQRTANFTSEQVIYDCHSVSNAIATGFRAITNNAEMFAGSLVAATATNSVTHAFQFIFNGASSNLAVDGTTNTVNPGSQGITNNVGVFIGASDSATVPLNGTLHEVGSWPSGFSAGNITSMNSNQHSYWGF